MAVTEVEQDDKTLTLTITTELDATTSQVWRCWDDPRLLERWWGPPTYPATVLDHDLVPGGGVTYFMTGPEGDRHHGWWRVVAADPPHRLALVDGFADDSGEPIPEMPTMALQVTYDATVGGGTRMAVQTTFPSSAAMGQLIEMGIVEGMTAAVGQIDDLLKSEITAT